MSSSRANFGEGTPQSYAVLRSAIEALADANRQTPSAALERALLDLRIAGMRDVQWPAPQSPPPGAPPMAPNGQLAEIPAHELTADTLQAAVVNGGGLIVRGFMEADRAAVMRDYIDRALEMRSEAAEAEDQDSLNRWFSRSSLVKGGTQQFWAKNAADRNSNVGSLWAVDSPAAAQAMIDFYGDVGLRELLHQCFGEPAVLSIKKWVLRKVPPKHQAGWHQDGRFLGDGIRTINLWLSLSHCGGQAAAPGMEIVADQRKTIHPTGTHGAMFDWVVGPEFVEQLDDDTPVLRPEFGPGDALFFDQYNLHRTQCNALQTDLRYAVESWFFAASRAPAKQGPLLF